MDNSKTSVLTKFRNKATALTVVGMTAAVSLPASAAAIDVTAVTTAIGDAAAPIAAIGAAVLVLMVGIKTWKWIRRAM